MYLIHDAWYLNQYCRLLVLSVYYCKCDYAVNVMFLVDQIKLLCLSNCGPCCISQSWTVLPESKNDCCMNIGILHMKSVSRCLFLLHKFFINVLEMSFTLKVIQLLNICDILISDNHVHKFWTCLGPVSLTLYNIVSSFFSNESSNSHFKPILSTAKEVSSCHINKTGSRKGKRHSLVFWPDTVMCHHHIVQCKYDIACITIGTKAEQKPKFKLTKDTPYLALMS